MLAAYAAGLAQESVALLALGGLAATAVACAGALSDVSGLIVVGLGGLVAEYGVAANEQGFELDTRAALWGSGLLLTAELLFLAAELRHAVLEGGDLVMRRLATTFGVVVASLVLGAVLSGVAALPSAGGLALQLAGVAAVAGVLALVLSLARR